MQSSVVPLLREAHAHAPIPLALLQPDLASFSDDIWMPDKAVQFPTLMVRHARLLVESGQLDEAWDEIEVTWELLRRYWLRAAPVHMMRQIEVVVEGNESMLWEVIAEWGRHPDQSRDRIVRAIRRLEQLAKGTDSARHLIHSRLLTAKLSLFPDQQPRQDIHNLMFRSRGGIESTWLWTVWRIQPWEWWRTERVLRWRASLVMAHVQAVSQRVEDRPFVLGDWSHMRGWDLAREALCSTTLMPENITWGLQVEAERIVLAQAESFRATMLRLALLDWQREHGRLPRSLSELVPTYFAEIPRDPQTAGHVVYFPHGRGEDVTDGAEGTQDFRIIVQKQRPFLALFGGGHEAPQTHFDNDVWEFTDRNGKSLSLSAALRFARVWYIENDDPGSDP